MKKTIITALIVSLTIVFNLTAFHFIYIAVSSKPDKQEHQVNEIILPQSIKIYGDTVVSEVLSVHDGDTFTANIKNWPPIVGDRISIRISDIDTPETIDHRPNIHDIAVKAKNFTSKTLKQGKKIELRNIKRDKYFRLNAEVYVDGRNLGEELIDSKLAHFYDGGTKKPW